MASRYTRVAIALHWAIALLILLNLWVGFAMGRAEGLEQFQKFQIHKSIGITVLLLSIARLAWRLTHPAPPLPAGMNALEKLAAHATHWVFYLLMLGLPITGWIMVSVSPFNLPTLLFNTVPWPHIAPLHDLPMPERKSIDDGTAVAHLVMVWTALALIALHVAAALKHQLWNRDGVLYRMIPLRILIRNRPENSL